MANELRTALPTYEERRAAGRALRDKVKRGDLGRWRPPKDRLDPIDLIEEAHAGRLERLISVRVGRMAVSPYAFLRGAASLMAEDFARMARTGIEPVICGDAHLGNFGFYASPERNLVFDLNDFDEAHPGPWEWTGMTEPTSAQDLFKGRHFDQEIIVLCIRWYLTFKLSSRDLLQMMAERGIALSHTTILRWVQQYVPEFEKRWNHFARPVGDSWRVDETYIKVKGQWIYLYRAVDEQGRTVDFLLSKRRDVAAAKRFFSRAAKQHGVPRVITLDGYAASHRAVDKLKTEVLQVCSRGEILGR